MKRNSFCLSELAAQFAAEFSGDPDYAVTAVNTLEEASSTDLSFLANEKYTEAMKKSKAGIICVHFNAPRESGKNYLLSENPSLTFQKIAEHLLGSSLQSGFTGIHPTAVIHPSSKVDPSATIGPYVVVDQRCTIGANTIIHSHTSISSDVHIGHHCTIFANCVLRERSILGNYITLQPSVVIGSCGFGYTMEKGLYQKLEQLGNVIVEDHVEIGSHTAIDRSRFKTTFVRQGTKIDNLCQIAHNVDVGPHNVIAAQTGIAGSSKTGRHVMLGGQVGVLGHVELDDEVMVATRGGVSKSLKKGKYRGSPAIPIQDYHRQEVYIRKIASYVERIKALEEKVHQLMELKNC